MVRRGIGSTSRRERERGFHDVCADAAFFTEMTKIAAQTVGHINRGGGEAVLDEPQTFRDAGGRPVVPSQKKPAVRRFHGPVRHLS